MAVPVETGALSAALDERFFSAALRDRSRPARALWDGAEEDSLRGLFLLQLKRQYDAAGSDEERRRCADAARWGLAALDHAEEVDSLRSSGICAPRSAACPGRSFPCARA